MSAINKAAIERWYQEVWNDGHEDVIDEIMHPNVVAHGLSQQPITGVETFKEFYRSFRENISDVNVVIEKSLAEGDYVTTLCLVTGKHIASGNPVSFTGTGTVLMEDGKIIEGWNNFDFLTLNVQMGKISPEQLA